MLKTIRSRFILTSVLFIIISSGIPIYILIHQFRENFNQRSRVMLNSSTNLLRYELYRAMMEGKKNIQDIVTSIGDLESVEHIRIFNEDGIIKYSSLKSEVGKSLNNISPDHVEFTKLAIPSVRILNKNDAYSLTEPIVNENQCQSCHVASENPIAYLDLDTHLTKAETIFFTGSVHMIFLGAAVILILIVGLYFIFTYFITKPLSGLNNALKIVEGGNLDVEIPSKTNDEIGRVHKRFNLMTKKLKSSRDQINELHFEQLQRADRLTTLGELTSQVAHEVNNHAAVIMSRADFLEMETSKQPELKLYNEDYKTILDQTKKISAITRNLLRHSKQNPSNKRKIDLEGLISRSILMLQPLLKKKNITCTFKSEVEKAEVIADELQIEQVLTNLIINAADAINDSGAIELKLLEKENKYNVLVIDNGQGIASEDLDKIFSPFYSSKPQGKGTGLGLYIVQKICKSHDVEIKCDSKLGVGTTFQLDFVKAE